MADSARQLVDRLLAGETRAIARSISIVEQEPAAAGDLLRYLYPHTGRALVLGLTGSPGSGKSSLVDGLVSVFREQGSKVGVVAVDPSSAYSGGAILGDRVRMQDRSMATRGHLGGLARATNDAIDILDGAGYDPILVETVGVGQDEIEIVKTADAVAVVLVPGMGDDIQAIKAGILEIADLFVINKADRDGADRLQSDLDYVMSLAPETLDRRPQIFRTVAVRRQGLAELELGIRGFVDSVGERRRRERRRERAEARFLSVLGERLLTRVHNELLAGTSYDELVSSIAERSVDPYTAAERVMERLEVR